MNEIPSLIVRLWARNVRTRLNVFLDAPKRERLAVILDRAAFTIANLEERVKRAKEGTTCVIIFLNQMITDLEAKLAAAMHTIAEQREKREAFFKELGEQYDKDRAQLEAGHRASYRLVEREIERLYIKLKAAEERAVNLRERNQKLEGQYLEAGRQLSALLGGRGGTLPELLDAYVRERSTPAKLLILDGENEQLKRWRINVTTALMRPGGTAYADVPALVKQLAQDDKAKAARIEWLEAESAQLRDGNARLGAELERLEAQLKTYEAEPGSDVRYLIDQIRALENELANRDPAEGSTGARVLRMLNAGRVSLEHRVQSLREAYRTIERQAGELSVTRAKLNSMTQEHKNFEKLAASEGSAQLEVSNLKAKIAQLEIAVQLARSASRIAIVFAPVEIMRKGRESITIPYVEKLEEENKRLGTELSNRVWEFEQEKRRCGVAEQILRQVNHDTKGYQR